MSLRLDVERAEPTFGKARGKPRDAVYRPNTGKQWRALTICAIFVVIAGGLSQGNLIRALRGAEPLHGQMLILALCGAFFLCMGLALVIGMFRGLPRLSVSEVDVRLDSLLGTSWAAWGSLGEFAIVTIATSRKRSIASARAPVIGKDASRAVLRRKKLSIPDQFTTPIGEIAADLNARRVAAAGLAPTLDAGVAHHERQFGLASFRAPWVTFALLAILALAFLGEQIFAVSAARSSLRPSLQTLVALGGLNRSLVAEGEWYRIFTAPFLHGDLVHIVSNGIALLLVGYSLERLVGRLWFIAFFFIGALGGGLMSMAVNPATLTSVGASGAIMGLFAAALVCSFRLPSETHERIRLQVRAFQVLFPSLLPLATSGSGALVDYGAHFGGALSGAAVAFLLLKTWLDSESLPRFRKLAIGIAATGVILTSTGFAASALHYTKYKDVFSLVPQSEMPKTDAERLQPARIKELVARFPLDPRPRLWLAAILVEAKDYAGAERELRVALERSEELRPTFGPDLVDAVRAMMAAVLLEGGHPQEAKDTARSVCGSHNIEVRQALAETHLCD